MDVFADILEFTRIAGRAGRAELRAPWDLRFRPGAEAAFAHVTQGSCVLRTADPQSAVVLSQGDLALLPHGTGHELSSIDGGAPVDFAHVWSETDPDGTLRLGGSGDACIIIWGAYCFAEVTQNPLLEVLPPQIVFSADQISRDRALGATLQNLGIEITEPRPGGAAVARRLVDILFVELIRNWSERMPESHRGWLLALRDKRVGLALSRIHAEPAHDWTVDALAREVALSRAAFAKRFTQLVGVGPVSYLTAWRMQLAARLLRTTDLSVAEIASRVGYESEFSFSRAFRRAWQSAPSHYRRKVPHGQSTPAQGRPDVSRDQWVG